jgi:hypothetical protein
MTWKADRADDVAYDRADVAVTWANQLLTRGIHRVDVKVPRGPITGCHMAPRV